MLCWRSDALVTNCKFARNSAGFGGGASCSEADGLILANCTLTSNSADVGGAVYSSKSGESWHIRQDGLVWKEAPGKAGAK